MNNDKTVEDIIDSVKELNSQIEFLQRALTAVEAHNKFLEHQLEMKDATYQKTVERLMLAEENERAAKAETERIKAEGKLANRDIETLLADISVKRRQLAGLEKAVAENECKVEKLRTAKKEIGTFMGLSPECRKELLDRFHA